MATSHGHTYLRQHPADGKDYGGASATHVPCLSKTMPTTSTVYSKVVFTFVEYFMLNICRAFAPLLGRNTMHA